MLLEGKVAVVYGGGGAIGGAAARRCARFPRRPSPNDIAANGGLAQAAQVDGLDTGEFERHADAVAAQAGAIDIALNAVGIAHVQDKPLAELSLEDYAFPSAAHTRTNFITARAVARHLVEGRAGVILTLSTPGSRLSGTGFFGYGVTSAAIEALSRLLAAELGASGIRVVCLRPDAIPAALAAGPHTREVFRGPAQRSGRTIEAMLAERARTATLARLPPHNEVAGAAAWLASERAGAMTGTVANLTCGSLLD